jgi:hypothetical protein
MRSARFPGLAVVTVSLLACDGGTAPPQASSTTAPSSGGRTSALGKAMDQAEDVKRQAEAYNQALDGAMAQGTADAPPKRPSQSPSPR